MSFVTTVFSAAGPDLAFAAIAQVLGVLAGLLIVLISLRSAEWHRWRRERRSARWASRRAILSERRPARRGVMRRWPQMVLEARVRAVSDAEIRRGRRLEELARLRAGDRETHIGGIEWPEADTVRNELLMYPRAVPTVGTVDVVQEEPIHPPPRRPAPPDDPIDDEVRPEDWEPGWVFASEVYDWAADGSATAHEAQPEPDAPPPSPPPPPRATEAPPEPVTPAERPGAPQPARDEEEATPEPDSGPGTADAADDTDSDNPEEGTPEPVAPVHRIGPEDRERTQARPAAEDRPEPTAEPDPEDRSDTAFRATVSAGTPIAPRHDPSLPQDQSGGSRFSRVVDGLPFTGPPPSMVGVDDLLQALPDEDHSRDA